MSTNKKDGLTIREYFALEFAKVIHQADLRLAERKADVYEAIEEQTSLCRDFYSTACLAAQMADDLACALKDERPGHRYEMDEEDYKSIENESVAASRKKDEEADVNVCIENATRTVYPCEPSPSSSFLALSCPWASAAPPSAQ